MKELIHEAIRMIESNSARDVINYLQKNISPNNEYVRMQLTLFEDDFKAINRLEIIGKESTQTILLLRREAKEKFLILLNKLASGKISENVYSLKVKNYNKWLSRSAVFLVFTLIFSTVISLLKISFAASIIIILIVFVLLFVFFLFNRVQNPKDKKYELNLSSQNAIYGGAIGGTFLGIVLCFWYYGLFVDEIETEVRKLIFYKHCLLTIPFGSVTGIVLGFFSYNGISLFNSLNSSFKNLSIILGGVVGGSLGALLMGILGVNLFVKDLMPKFHTEYASFLLFLSFAFVILGLLFYSYKGGLKYLLRILIIMFSTLFILFIFLDIVMTQTNLYSYIDQRITGFSIFIEKYKAGGIYGLVAGAFGGLFISLTIVLYKVWNYADIQRFNDMKQNLPK